MSTQELGKLSVVVTDTVGVTDEGTALAWKSATFAPSWFADAISETQSAGPHFRRREIVFAEAAAESYLFEWVRDQILRSDFNQLDRYFPPGEIRPILERFKYVLKKLKSDGLIAAIPDFSTSTTWQEFTELVNQRNGLLHAGASRPETTGRPPKSMPVPSMEVLDGLAPGSSIDIVRRLIIEICIAAGTPVPSWL
jgi:hypothetical protein